MEKKNEQVYEALAGTRLVPKRVRREILFFPVTERPEVSNEGERKSRCPRPEHQSITLSHLDSDSRALHVLLHHHSVVIRYTALWRLYPVGWTFSITLNALAFWKHPS